ncbi:MAG: bifunctional indole-3-glycerol phosphate synthase/phosphoribosylanthranilate isomerase, partial [Gemmatimonadaceae bacterium]|nr:bifunctional indole-3-glycerol phosphate synthase/phosphoribosylanthranilate isomerase [Gemmatimonadaceae bacterium]
MAEIKFCGLTRAEDAALGCELGASYLGVIFAGGPRAISIDRARVVLGASEGNVRRVGVFARAAADEIARAVEG